MPYFCSTNFNKRKMDNFDLTKKVKELRTRRGLSQEQLADLTLLSLRTIQRIENGENVPRGDTLKRLAVALNVSPDEIIDWRVQEDRNVLFMLNFSQLGLLAFPL
ncbi:MAG TPA: helix-turn-helix transcriptional regulator, partial [Paludibacter sp.]